MYLYKAGSSCDQDFNIFSTIKLHADHNALRFVKLCRFIAHTHILDACVCPADCMRMHVFVTGVVIG